MTLLEKAFEALRELPAEEQDRYAEWILDEIEADQRWDDLFARSQDMLAKMADEALADYLAGNTIPLDPDELEKEELYATDSDETE